MNQLFDLSGRKILVTGASSGIGRATAVLAAQMGATVVLSGRDPARLAETKGMMTGLEHVTLPHDLADLTSMSAFVEALPVLDGVVSCAGANQLKPLKFIDAQYLARMNVINFQSPLVLVNELAKKKKLSGGGSIVFISSIGALIATPGNAAYAGAKAGLIASARILALELSKQRIRVNCVSPGMVRTPMADQMLQSLSPELKAMDEMLYPLGYGVPDDVAASVIYLLSAAARWVTGINLILDGGYTAK